LPLVALLAGDIIVLEQRVISFCTEVEIFALEQQAKGSRIPRLGGAETPPLQPYSLSQVLRDYPELVPTGRLTVCESLRCVRLGL
jgi:hypothetical protein